MIARVISSTLHKHEVRAERELRAVNRALNFTQGKRPASWAAYLEWLDLSIESAMRHTVQL